MPYLEHLQGYTGQAAISNANGAVDTCLMIVMQVQLVGDDSSPWSDWIGDEEAIVKPIGPGVPRLSGVGIRGV